MKRFNFVQDVKMTMWVRQSFFVDADTEEEAIEMAEEFSDEDVSTYDNFVGYEKIEGSEEVMTTTENQGEPTILIYSADDLARPILSNE